MFIIFYISIYKANVYYIYKPHKIKNFHLGKEKKLGGFRKLFREKIHLYTLWRKKDVGFLYGLFSFKFMALLFLLLIILKLNILNQEKSSIIFIL